MISYEWDIESLDANGEIEDHNHSEKIPKRPLEKNERLVLVRDGDRFDRSWAYVQNGFLDTHFKDAYGHEVTKVPARFVKEFLKSVHSI